MADDDPQLLRLMTRNLQFEDYDVTTANDGEKALALVETQIPDLLILDVMMPRMDGFNVCQKVREFSQVPIIIVTARGNDQDKVHGLDLGADDYLTKPFNVEELLARVRAVLRRTQFAATETQPAIAQIGSMTIDYTQHLVTMGGREMLLTPTEYRIVSHLAQNVGRVVTQDRLLEYVWGPEYIGESHMLHVNVNRVRRKLEPDPAQPSYLITKPGIGYSMAEHTPADE